MDYEPLALRAVLQQLDVYQGSEVSAVTAVWSRPCRLHSTRSPPQPSLGAAGAAASPPEVASLWFGTPRRMIRIIT